MCRVSTLETDSPHAPPPIATTRQFPRNVARKRSLQARDAQRMKYLTALLCNDVFIGQMSDLSQKSIYYVLLPIAQ
jgi:hypothetical protein